MIDLRKKLIIQGEKEEPIKHITTWWRGPFGLYTELDLALSVCTKNDWAPELVLKPVTVFVSETMTEEV